MQAEISAALVKNLRDETGAAMMDCKRALVEAEGDKDRAREILRARGVAIANKRATRDTSEGLVVAALAADGEAGVIVEINCETDFVARNESFGDLAREIADVALRSQASDVDSLLSQSLNAHTVRDAITAAVAKTGENIGIKRMTFYQVCGAAILGCYVHSLGGKIGCLLELAGVAEPGNREAAQAVARELAMHIASAKPQYISRAEIPACEVESERRIERDRDDLKGKPDNIRDKIVEGRVSKLLAERCLLDQPFIKDPGKTVKKWLHETGKALGTELTPTRFVLFNVKG